MSRSVRGFAMPIVVALVAVFATVLGSALVTMSSAHHVGLGLDIQGVRAYHAARAGLEWGMYHVLRPGFGGCAGVHNTSVAFGGNLVGFRAVLTCGESAHDEGGTTITLYAITSTACNAAAPCGPATPGPDYVDRQLRATVSK
jgi:MSHA biogenesis protein MshP